MTLQPGMRVRFKSGSPNYQAGARTGVIVSTNETVQQLFRRKARAYGLPLAFLVKRFLAERPDLAPRGRWKKVRFPVVAVDGFGEVPDGFEFACDPSQFEVAP
jgi:hypothetical protein